MWMGSGSPARPPQAGFIGLSIDFMGTFEPLDRIRHIHYWAGYSRHGAALDVAGRCVNDDEDAHRVREAYMSVRHFESYDCGHVSRSLEMLHDEVVRFKGRIEITRPGSSDRCVLISKAELDSLERALAILSDTDEVKAMSGVIAQLAATCEAPAGV
jgi:PHD/YefM family antitoxin component YafN of YafNO toxin-antitoxin module